MAAEIIVPPTISWVFKLAPPGKKAPPAPLVTPALFLYKK